jgi:four helix bundle protein
MAEAYERNLPKYFYSKLTDSDGENFETQVWLNLHYLVIYSEPIYHELISLSLEIEVN